MYQFQAGLQTDFISPILTLNCVSACDHFRRKAKTLKRRPGQISWRDASTDSDELLKRKQFETLPKLCWQNGCQQPHFQLRNPRNFSDATVHQRHF